MEVSLKDRRNKLAQEVFGHSGVGYSIMEPYVKNFIDRFIALEDEVTELQDSLGFKETMVEEFLPDNPGDSSPYFYHVTERESDAREQLYVDGKLMHRFVTRWEEVK